MGDFFKEELSPDILNCKLSQPSTKGQRAEHHPKQNHGENTNVYKSEPFILVKALGVSNLQSNINSLLIICGLSRFAFVKEKYIHDG